MNSSVSLKRDRTSRESQDPFWSINILVCDIGIRANSNTFSQPVFPVHVGPGDKTKLFSTCYSLGCSLDVERFDTSDEHSRVNCAVSVSFASTEAVWQPRSVICSTLGLLQPPADESCPVYDPPSNHGESPSYTLSNDSE